MNEKIHIRRTPAPVKTPRISVQSSNGQFSANQHLPFNPPQKNVLPFLPSSNDSNQLITLKHSFHNMIDCLSRFLTHNASIIMYRSQVSQQATDVERLFNSFFQSITKGPFTQIKSNPTIRTAAITFLKSWQLFALSIIDLRTNGPGQISQCINSHYNTISSSLEIVMNNGITKSNIHDQSYRNGRVLQNQLNILKQSSDTFLIKSKKADELNRISAELKAFSRTMNDTFAREFTQCGFAQNEVVRLRSKCYTACSDIIHSLKNSYLFEADLIKLIFSLITFQDNLKILLEKLNLPLNYLVSIDIDSDCMTINDEDEEEEKSVLLDESLGLMEFVNDAQEKSCEFIKDQIYIDKFFEILNNKIENFVSEANSKGSKKELDEQKISEQLSQFSFENNIIKKENENLISELNFYKTESQNLRHECEELKETLNQTNFSLNNSEQLYLFRISKMKKALHHILGISPNNDFVGDDDDDDDNLINKSIEQFKQYQNSIQTLRETEDKLKKILQTEDITKRVSLLLEELKNSEKKEKYYDQLYKEKEEKLKDIFHQFSKLDSLTDVADEVSDSFRKLNHIVECESLSEGIDFIFMLFSEVTDFLSRMTNDKDTKNLRKLINKLDDSISSAKDILRSVLNHDGTIHEMSKEVVDIHFRFMNNFSAILTTLDQNIPQSSIDVAAVESVKNIHSTFNEISQQLYQITGNAVHPPTPPTEFILQQIKNLDKKVNQDRSLLLELQTLLSEVEESLTKYCEITISNNSSKTPIHKNIRLLLKKLPQKQVQTNTNEQVFKEKNNSLNLFLKNVENVLCGIIKSEKANDDERQSHILELINTLNQKLKDTQDFIAQVEMKLGIKNESYEKILAKLNPQSNAKDIEKYFLGIFDLVPVTSRSDPSHYIPEFCNAFISLHNSIIILKPFASILNSVFSQFDCKLQSFIPTSQSYQFIRNQVFALHTALNSLSPSKVNSLVFLILSRFVALMSSFMAAISAASFDDGDPNMKETFFKMQLELCEAKKAM